MGEYFSSVSQGGKMSDKHMILWDFDGTLGHRPGMWSRAVLDVLQARYPDYAFTLDDVRPFMR